MKLSVSLYSYSYVLNSGEYSLEDCFRHAKEQGFVAVEANDLDYYESGQIVAETSLFKDHIQELSKAEKATRLSELSEQYDLPIICYAIGSNFSDCPLDKMSNEAERLLPEFDIAATLGCSFMRIDLFSYPHKNLHGIDEHNEAILPYLRQLLDTAKSKGIELLIENHGTLYDSASRLLSLFQRCPELGLLCDLGNFLETHSQVPQDVLGLAPYIRHVHVKDFHIKPGHLIYPGEGWYDTSAGQYLRGAVVGHGDLDLPSCLKFLNNHAYKGYLSLEFEGIEYAPFAIQLSADYLQRLDAYLPLFSYDGHMKNLLVKSSESSEEVK